MSLKKIGVGLSILCLGMSASTSFASFSDNGLIDHPLINSAGIAFFYQGGTRTSIANCQGSTVQKRWAFNTNTLKGQAMLSTVLTAYATGKPVVVQGTGSCSDWADSETVEWIMINN